MKRVRYTKFTGDLASSLGLEDLMQALSEFLLDSGFQDPYSYFSELNNQTMENLRDAIRQALDSGELFDEEMQEAYEALSEDEVEELIDRIIQKLQEQNYINAEMPQERQGQQGDGNGEARFEVTDKAMDFLGYKALRELLGPLGRSNLGRHDTRYEAAGVETNGSSKQYTIMGGPNLSKTVDQQYSGGLPTNMLIYHNWVDVASYNGPSDRGLVSLRTTAALSNYLDDGALNPGMYRLRVDTLDNNGISFTGSATYGHKGYAVRVVNGDMNRSTCANCQVAAWDEMCFFTPFDAGSGGSFAMSLFELSPDYAGLIVSVDIWDVGDISSTNGRVVINILDPTGNNTFPGGVNIYDLGTQRSNLASGNYAVWASAASGNTAASFVAEDTSTGQSADNRWIHLEIQVPSNYNPVPGNDWWTMQYVTGPGTVAVDTVTVAVGLKGGPVHLVR